MEDVTLSPGWSYFVEHKAYMEHVAKFANQEEVRSYIHSATRSDFLIDKHLCRLRCNSPCEPEKDAWSIRYGCRRYDVCTSRDVASKRAWRSAKRRTVCASGSSVDVLLMSCSRYCNMDYIFLSSLRVLGAIILTIVASYDIACQYFKNFFARMDDVPERLKPSFLLEQIIAKVAKAHLVGHNEKCQGPFSFNWTFGCGRTDGEGIERCWSGLNKAAPSVREMTAAGRRETIDDFCGFWNWKKNLGLGEPIYIVSLSR